MSSPKSSKTKTAKTPTDCTHGPKTRIRSAPTLQKRLGHGSNTLRYVKSGEKKEIQTGIQHGHGKKKSRPSAKPQVQITCG